MPEMDPQSTAKLTFDEGIRQGLSWGNVGYQLAGGVVSGIGSWAAEHLLEYLFAEHNGMTLGQLLHQFEDDLKRAVQDIETYLDEALLAVEVLAKIESITEQFPTLATEYDALERLWMEAVDAKSVAAILSRDNLRPNLVAFGVYFTVLDLEIGIAEQLRTLPPPAGKTPFEHWRQWQGASAHALDLGAAHFNDLKTLVYGIDDRRVTIVRQDYDHPEYVYVIWVDGTPTGYQEPDLGQAEQLRNQVVRSLQGQHAQHVFDPAEAILRRLAALRKWIWPAGRMTDFSDLL